MAVSGRWLFTVAALGALVLMYTLAMNSAIRQRVATPVRAEHRAAIDKVAAAVHRASQTALERAAARNSASDEADDGDDEEDEAQARADGEARVPLPRNTAVLVFPSLLGPESPEVQRERLQAVRATWAGQISQQHRVFYVQWFGSEPVIDSEQLLRVPAEHNLSFATRILWAYDTLVQRFDPDWIVKADDVTYVVVDNLVQLLLARDATEPHYLGHRLQGPGMPRPFLSAGAGYAMSRPVIAALVHAYRERHTCVERSGGAEDTTLALCLDETAGIKAGPSVDVNGGEYFNAFCPLTLAQLHGSVYSVAPNDTDFWYVKYRAPFGGVKLGPQCCAARTATFHYVLPDQMRALHQALNGPKWPSDFQPYANHDQRQVLEPFLAKIVSGKETSVDAKKADESVDRVLALQQAVKR